MRDDEALFSLLQLPIIIRMRLSIDTELGVLSASPPFYFLRLKRFVTRVHPSSIPRALPPVFFPSQGIIWCSGIMLFAKFAIP